MVDFEKLGTFYLGREYDAASGKAAGDLVLYDSKDLTTHAVCVGMTGSGKTGLGLYTVFNLVTHKLKGQIALGRSAEGGVRFTLRFPAVLPA